MSLQDKIAKLDGFYQALNDNQRLKDALISRLGTEPCRDLLVIMPVMNLHNQYRAEVLLLALQSPNDPLLNNDYYSLLEKLDQHYAKWNERLKWCCKHVVYPKGEPKDFNNNDPMIQLLEFNSVFTKLQVLIHNQGDDSNTLKSLNNTKMLYLGGQMTLSDFKKSCTESLEKALEKDLNQQPMLKKVLILLLNIVLSIVVVPVRLLINFFGKHDKAIDWRLFPAPRSAVGEQYDRMLNEVMGLEDNMKPV